MWLPSITLWLLACGLGPAIVYCVGIRRGGEMFRSCVSANLRTYYRFYAVMVILAPVVLGASEYLPASDALSVLFVLGVIGLLAFAVTGLLALVLMHQMLNWIGVDGREDRGECLQCGYDLTGNVTGVCPECGERFR
jgi:protein-S-isoprenylcysteine O-methyltransferase Ste14